MSKLKCLSLCLTLSPCLSLSLSLWLPDCLSGCLTVFLPVCLFFSLTVSLCLRVYLSVSLTVFLSPCLTVLQLYQPVLKTHWPAQLKRHCRLLELRRQPCRLSHSIHTNWRRLWKQRYRAQCQWSQGCGVITVMLMQIQKVPYYNAPCPPTHLCFCFFFLCFFLFRLADNYSFNRNWFSYFYCYSQLMKSLNWRQNKSHDQLTYICSVRTELERCLIKSS